MNVLRPVILLAGLAAAPAFAQAPRVQPSRDVVVSYQVEGQALGLIPGGVQGPVRLSWDAVGQRVRAEAEGRSQVALLDLRNHTGQAFDTGLHITLPLRVRERDLQPITLAGARLTLRGRDVVAGLPCTVYVFTSPQGPGEVCLTPDGVPLRGRGAVNGKPGSFTALAVTYGPLPPSLFEPPPGYADLGGRQGNGLAGLMQSLLRSK